MPNLPALKISRKDCILFADLRGRDEQNKNVLTDSQPGYVLSMFLKFGQISASTFL